jgi:Adenylylsulphate kinase
LQSSRIDNPTDTLMKPASLFIGRWSPFHEGHQALIESVLRTGKPVVIAIRDTEPSANNPYSTSERWQRIQDALQSWGSMVRIVVIPDIDEVCYGRDVGYGIRKIELTDDVHKISATQKRSVARPAHSIIWLTGQSGSGKTTLAHELKSLIGNAVILDGNEMRESISDEGFSPTDRQAHNLRVARLAQVLARQSVVVVSVIAPFANTRGEITRLIKPLWIYCKRQQQQTGDEYPYDTPDLADVVFVADGDAASASENAAHALEALSNSIAV